MSTGKSTVNHLRRNRHWRRTLALAGVLGTGLNGWADPAYSVQGPFVTPQEGTGIPSPKEVSGKEYSTLPNKNFNHATEPGRTLLWDGAGGVADGRKFDTESEPVDALGYHADVLFGSVWANRAALAYSVAGDGTTAANRERIWAEPVAGGAGVWARSSDVNHDSGDLNGLELWGPEGVSDADRYSLAGDPSNVSIHNLDGSTYLSRSELASALGYAGLAVDLDAMMLQDNGVLGRWDSGDLLIFSIAPVNDPGSGAAFDGGEIWTWIQGFSPSPLFHNGHLWDTAYNVMANTPNASSEDVDAIEAIAVPEPGAWAGAAGLLCVGVALATRSRRMT
jgi:hypothetical protein